MKVGFTGTRNGMSQSQKEQFVLLLNDLKPSEFHHGDCTGADAEAHDIVREFFPACKIVVHPPKSTYLQAFKQGDQILEPLNYLVRDKKIVDMTHYLVGAPLTDVEQKGSGTWYTIRYATKTFKEKTVLKR